MTDLDISKALALAIGWEPNRIASVGFGDVAYINVKRSNDWANQWQTFDYRDWNVIGPIAEKYDCFPLKAGDSWLSRYLWRGCGVRADTPQKAIALAVIGAKK